MSILLGIRHILRSLVSRRAADAETLEELADHVARQTRKHVDEGMNPIDAERLARIRLGGVQRWRDETAETRIGSLGAGLIGDCTFALRTLRKRPGFAAVAVLSLALGLGASSAIFAVIDGALLRPLPFPDADRFASISLRMPIRASRTVVDMSWSYPKYTMFRDQQRALSTIALNSAASMTLSDADGVQRFPGEAVTSAYFTLLGARPAIGRTFTAAEDSIGGGGSVVIVSDGFWRTHFGADPNVLGRTVEVSGAKRTIVGVMHPGFQGLSGDAELWLPITGSRSASMLASAGAHNMSMVGRLRDGTTPPHRGTPSNGFGGVCQSRARSAGGDSGRPRRRPFDCRRSHARQSPPRPVGPARLPARWRLRGANDARSTAGCFDVRGAGMARDTA